MRLMPLLRPPPFSSTVTTSTNRHVISGLRPSNFQPDNSMSVGPLRSWTAPSLVARALATDSAGELDVLGHDGDALGVDGAEVGVLEEADQIMFGTLLQRQ